MDWYESDTVLEEMIEDEIEKFALFIRTFPVDENKANRAILTNAKKELIRRTKFSSQVFIDALFQSSSDPKTGCNARFLKINFYKMFE